MWQKMLAPPIAAIMLMMGLPIAAGAQTYDSITVQSRACFDSDGDRVPCGSYYYESTPQNYWDDEEDDDE